MGRIDFVSRIKNFRPDTVCYFFMKFIYLTLVNIYLKYILLLNTSNFFLVL